LNKGQIIAIGGGGFGRNPNKPLIEEYIVNQSNTSKPNILFIPTASAEDKGYTVNFYKAFGQFNTSLSLLNFFQRTPRLDSLINKQDIIYVGGGNTKSMIAVWKEWKLDKLLHKAYDRGAILCGVSAGSICWFDKGITDSWASNLNIMDCLSILPGTCCPHYDSEADRRPIVHKLIKENTISDCYASEDGAAIHFDNGKVKTGISFYKDSNSYLIKKEKNTIVENKIDSIDIS
tara:strand:- start:66 stop:764 length:699 start_codon:yes stop_codon:yes gene_type:complete